MQSFPTNLVELFTSVTEEYPDRIAVKDANRSLTFRELYNKAWGAAVCLLEFGLQPADRIACISKKNVESITCFWAILLAGGTPVMLDQEDGMATNLQKIKVVDSNMVICEPGTFIANKENDSFNVWDFADVLRDATPLEVRNVVVPEICYILLTSGTSGFPKAVPISHKNVMHYVLSMYDYIGSPDSLIAAHVTTFSADLGLTNLLLALISGGTLRIFNKEESTDPRTFIRLLEKDQISFIKMTPSHFISMVFNLTDMTHRPIDILILGGEKLSWHTVNDIYNLGFCRDLYNHYGPTETTIGASVFKVSASSIHYDQTASVPIGMPVGEGIYFLHEEAEGVGELHIAGPGVSRGYLGNAEENENKFYNVIIGGIEQRCFRTGDLCRRLDDNNFEFLYRKDRQVKIRGYRIELGEIEHALLTNPLIDNAIVLLSDHQVHGSLEALIKLKPDACANENDIRNWLITKLPKYKIPGNIYFFSITPYTLNGKIDIKQLKAELKQYHLRDFPKETVVDSVSWQTDVSQFWKSLLNRKDFKATDNFFEIGGDSLLSIQLIGKLQRYGYLVHIGDLNNNPVYQDFLALNLSKNTNRIAIKADQIIGIYHTYSQAGFLTEKKFKKDHYCQTILLESEKHIQIRAFAQAVDYVIKSHLQLGKVFDENAVFAKSTVENPGLGLSIIDSKASTAYKIQEVHDKLINEISLYRGDLFKAHVFIGNNAGDHILFICHHLAIDVISWSLIIDEVIDYYQQILTNTTPVIFAEDNVNQFYKGLSISGGELLNRTHSVVLPEKSVILLPLLTRYPGNNTRVSSLALDSEVCELLRSLEDQNDASVSGYLLSAISKAVLEEFKIQEITIDVEFHGRPKDYDMADVSRSVAWWSVTLPLNVSQENSDIVSCSRTLKQKADEAVEMNTMIGWATTRRIIPDVRFNYLGHFPEKFENSSICLKPSPINPGSTRDQEAQREYKMFFTVRSIGDETIFDIQYQNSWFEESQILRISKHISTNLKRTLKGGTLEDSVAMPDFGECNIPSVGQPLFYPRIIGRLRTSSKTILLTGVTGFLGIHLLRELLKFDNISVTCLIRKGNKLEATQRLKATWLHYFGPDELLRADVQVVEGDLTFGNLGLIESVYNRLLDNVDLILHAAADTNLLKDYKDLYAANVSTVQKLIDFANTGVKKEIHYISTLAVSGFLPDAISREFSELDFDYGQSFLSDYERTKFEAEKRIRNFFRNGKNGKIYRTGHIAADSLKGKFQLNIAQNRIFQIIKGAILLGQLPNNFTERVGFSYVDVVSKGIVGLCLNDGLDKYDCYHVDNPQSSSFIEIAVMLNDLGYQMELVDLNTFFNSATSFNGTIGEQETIDLMCLWIQRFMSYPKSIIFRNGLTLDRMAQMGVYFPKADVPWFNLMISDGIRNGYFDTPAIQRKKRLKFKVQNVNPIIES